MRLMRASSNVCDRQGASPAVRVWSDACSPERRRRAAPAAVQGAVRARAFRALPARILVAALIRPLPPARNALRRVAASRRRTVAQHTCAALLRDRRVRSRTTGRDSPEPRPYHRAETGKGGGDGGSRLAAATAVGGSWVVRDLCAVGACARGI